MPSLTSKNLLELQSTLTSISLSELDPALPILDQDHSDLSDSWDSISFKALVRSTIPQLHTVPQLSAHIAQLHARHKQLKEDQAHERQCLDEIISKLTDLKSRRNDKKAWAEKLKRQNICGSLSKPLKPLMEELHAEIDVMDEHLVELQADAWWPEFELVELANDLIWLELQLDELESKSQEQAKSDPQADLDLATRSAQQAKDYLDTDAFEYWKGEAHAALDLLLAE